MPIFRHCAQLVQLLHQLPNLSCVQYIMLDIYSLFIEQSPPDIHGTEASRVRRCACWRYQTSAEITPDGEAIIRTSQHENCKSKLCEHHFLFRPLKIALQN